MSVTQKKCSNCHWWNGRVKVPPSQSDFCNFTITDEVGPMYLGTQAWIGSYTLRGNWYGGVLVTKEDFYCIQWKEVEDG